MESMSKFWKRFRTKKSPASIMIVGLDNSGKTSILNNLLSLDKDTNKGIKLSGQHPSQANYSSPVSIPSHKTGDEVQLCPSLSPTPTVASIKATTTGIMRDGRDIDRAASNTTPTVGYNYEQIQYKSLTMTVLDFSGHTRYRNLWQEFYNAVDAVAFVIDSSDLIRLCVVRDEIETMVRHPCFCSLSNQTIENAPSKLPLSASMMLVQKKIIIKQGKLVQSPLDSGNSPSNRANVRGDRQDNGQRSGKSHTNPRRRTKVPLLFLTNKADLANSIDTEVIIKALDLNRLPLDRHPWFIQATSVKLGQGIAEGFDWLISQLETNN